MSQTSYKIYYIVMYFYSSVGLMLCFGNLSMLLPEISLFIVTVVQYLIVFIYSLVNEDVGCILFFFTTINSTAMSIF